MILRLKNSKRKPLLLPGARPIQPLEKLWSTHKGKIEEIKSITSLSNKYWVELYQAALESTLALAQELPASEYHHHSHPGGLAEHAIDVCLRALKYRQGKLLPLGATPDEQTKQSQLWTYAVFTGALLHDIGKPFSDQVITTYDTKNKKIKQWNPLVEPITAQHATSYTIEYSQKDKEYRRHELLAPLFIRTIIPTCGISWLSSEPKILNMWLEAVNNTGDEENIIQEIIKRADRDSVAADLNGVERKTAAITRIKPLPERLSVKLRQLIEDETLSTNKFGCAGWLKDGYAWMVVKTTIDALRDTMISEGQTGIPSHNIRVIEELQGAGYLAFQEIGGKNKATFTVTISHPDWPKALANLTVLKFKSNRIWPNAANMPGEFSGEIIENKAVSTETPSPKTPPPAEATPSLPKETTPDHSEGCEKNAPNQKNDSTGASAPPPAQPEQPQDEIQAAPSPQPASPRELAAQFIDWVSEGINNRSLLINDAAAYIHCIPEGVLLVSPKIFRAFSKENWALTQKGFLRLKINAKTETGNNIFECKIEGGGTFKSLLVPEPVKNLKLNKEPHLNKLLTLKTPLIKPSSTSQGGL